MKFILPGPDTITIAGHTVQKLIRAGDGDAALLYLYILKTRGTGTSGDAALALRKSEREITAAMTLLSKLSLIEYDGGEAAPSAGGAPEMPAVQGARSQYAAEDIRREIENGSAFAALVDEAQKSLGKILSSDDLTRLFGIYDGLRLPPEVILQLITYCIGENRRRYGGGRMPTMRYIEKAAYTWEREGIFSLERAEAYIKRLEQTRSAAGEIMKALQIKDRELSSSERKYVEGWIGMGFGADAVEIAYDRTLLKTGKLAWGYMDSIINSWHGKGLYKPEEILEKDARGAPRAQGARHKSETGKYGAPNQGDIDRMRKLLEKIKED